MHFSTQFSPLMSWHACFTSFLSFTPQKMRRPLRTKNFAPQASSCWLQCWALVGPCLGRKIMQHNTRAGHRRKTRTHIGRAHSGAEHKVARCRFGRTRVLRSSVPLVGVDVHVPFNGLSRRCGPPAALWLVMIHARFSRAKRRRHRPTQAFRKW